MNSVPELIEINLGFPDFRVKIEKVENLPFSQVKVLLKALPNQIKNVGIGGSPLRFKWWKEFIDQLSILKKNIILVERVSQIDHLKAKFVKKKGIGLFLEVENLNQIRKILRLKDGCEMFLVSLEKVYKDKHFFDALMKAKVPFKIETITWRLNDGEINKMRQFLGWPGNVARECEIAKNKVIGLSLDGNFYPCVALQFPEFKLGNIFSDCFDKILRSYLKFKKKLGCKYCCQARSWSKYKALNQDFLCYHQC